VVDVVDYIRLKDCNCVVVGIVGDKEKEGALQTYYVLIIREKAEGRGYKRVGVGKMEARYISRYAFLERCSEVLLCFSPDIFLTRL